MALEPDFRPYAATANVISIMTRARSRNLPPTIDADFMRVAQIPDAVVGRVKQALEFLGLIQEDGTQPAPIFPSVCVPRTLEGFCLEATWL